MKIKKKIREKLDNRIKDISIPDKYSLKSIGISNSLLSYYRNCPRSFLLRLNRYCHYNENKNTSFGNIIHWALDKIYQLTEWEEGTKTEYEELIKSILGKYEDLNPENCVGIDPQELNWEINVAHIILIKYVELYYSDFEDKVFTDLEQEISVKLSPFVVNLKIDGKFAIGEKIWLMEHKTRSRITEESMMKRLTIDQQNLTYITSAERYYKKNICGMLYNIIRKPQIRQKKNEIETNYYQRLAEDIESRPEFYFMRYEVAYTYESKIEFLSELNEQLNELQIKIERCRKEKKNTMFYKNTGSCELPYVCSYIDACSSGRMLGYYKQEKVFPELKSIKF